MAQLAFEFLGSGGAVRTPRPGCFCENCRGARAHGVPWARMSPSVFIHGPDLLVDTGEDSMAQLERSGITHIAGGLYSHWHPDHTAGQRMWESRNHDFMRWPSQHRTTPLYISSHVLADFKTFGVLEPLVYKERMGFVAIHAFDEPLELGGWRITPFPVAQSYVDAFHFEEVDGGRTALLCMDELYGWEPPAWVCGVDLAILPKGLSDVHPLTGERIMAEDHPILQAEATWSQTLEMAKAIGARHTVFTHIEEPDPVTPPQLEQLAQKVAAEEGLRVTFAHDTLVVQC
jgi:phosphoribosyl 1,2-cyclic phosphate phosphodiesterase